MSLLQDWKSAKKEFETTAGKKRPGMNPSKAARFFKVFQSETGLTPACETFDKLDKTVEANWKSLDAKKRETALQGLEAGLDEVKQKGKAYRDQLAKSIASELDDDSDMVRALKNLDNHIEMILKSGKSQVASRRSLFEVEKKNLGPMEAMNAQVVAELKATGANLQKAAAGMEVLVRNIKADPTRDTFVKLMTSPTMPVRYATTALQSVAIACKQSAEAKKAIGDIFQGTLDTLRDYGAAKDAGHWTKAIGTGNEKTAVMHHVAAMESQIPKLKLIASAVKKAGG